MLLCHGWFSKARAGLQEEAARKSKTVKAGNFSGVSGRDLFTLNPDLIAGDDDEAADMEHDPATSLAELEAIGAAAVAMSAEGADDVAGEDGVDGADGEAAAAPLVIKVF